MAVYREGYHAVEQIQKTSVSIFDDACDYGAPCRKDDAIWNYTKQLFDWYKVNNTRNESRYISGASVETVVELMDEWAVSDGRKTQKQATERYRVTFVTCTTGKCKGYSGYVTVEKLK